MIKMIRNAIYEPHQDQKNFENFGKVGPVLNWVLK